MKTKLCNNIKTCLKVVHVMFRFLMPILQSFLHKAKKEMCFYLRSNKFTDQSKPWYLLVLVVRNYLGSMLKDMCAEAQVSGKFSNHSFREYCTTTLYCANLLEKLIQERISHSCLKVLR